MMITDVVMPELDGRELADQLKIQRPEMKVLFMSGYTADVIVQRGVDDNVVGLLRKPFSQVALAGRVREVLAGPERASRSRRGAIRIADAVAVGLRCACS